MRRVLPRVRLPKLPTRDELAASRAMRPVAHILRDPSIWRFNRRSVARGVALGMFAGILIPFAQSLAAALVAIPLRANIAVAALCTFISNPLTTPLIYAGAYEAGSRLLHAHGADFMPPGGGSIGEFLTNLWDWLLSASLPTLAGLATMAITASVLGYLIAHALWRARVARRWNRRRQRARGRETQPA